ncbi:MAG: hypothetical protein IJF98_01360 [Firmicutes bacterium]|nr:hypothetical protein [Bacillota bacterium]
MGIVKKIIETVPEMLPKKESEYGPEHKPAPKKEDIEKLKKAFEDAEKFYEDDPKYKDAEEKKEIDIFSDDIE